MKLDAITITGRHRHSMGDIAGLAESMNTVGLLQPVVVTGDRALVAGARRLAAARSLGWDEIDVRVVDTLDDAAALLRAERDENTCRKDFTPSEEHAVYQALLELEKPKAKQQQGTRTDRTGELPPQSGRSSRERAGQAVTGKQRGHERLDKVGRLKGITADDTQAERIRDAAAKALDEIDATGKVDGAYQKFTKAEKAENDRPLNDWVHGGEDAQRVEFQAAFARSILRAHKAVLDWDVQTVADLAEHEQIDSLQELAKSFSSFAADVRKKRGGLRVVGGGTK
ncbi:MAG: ParB N-terminal domain-containing protein [Streptosporangiales bacterium]